MDILELKEEEEEDHGMPTGKVGVPNIRANVSWIGMEKVAMVFVREVMMEMVGLVEEEVEVKWEVAVVVGLLVDQETKEGGGESVVRHMLQVKIYKLGWGNQANTGRSKSRLLGNRRNMEIYDLAIHQ
jgi:hypothetical protein